ncbi:hypothetical protein ARMGADRAFT_927746 [Armillaria gallica]|uniref:Uncharacterized protein n=1 Tax=Armillaria gallica TaxID=47427 RepID=A0A2H3DGV9_ARMGA|nr:hypothetical protein ARMGADRAFT_927746 [Armillaria gallica]
MKDKACFLSQSVKVTGLGGESFGHSMAALKEICQTGERQFKEGKLQQWSPEYVQGFEVVDVSNRYFRLKVKSAEDTGIELVQEIDPNSILRGMANNMLIHMDDNVVHYYKATMDNGKNEVSRYSKARPQIFRVGNVVEVQFSIAFIKARNTTTRMKLVLRAVAMVDCQHAMNADREKKRMAIEARELKLTTRMKRKIGFEDEDKDEEEESRSQEGPGK